MQDKIYILPSRKSPGTEEGIKSNLPPQLTSLIGREQEVAVASALLSRPQVRLLTFTGPGGVGKTRLALQTASDLLDDFPDGVYFVSLAPISDPDLVIPTIAQTLGLWEGKAHLLFEQLKTYLQGKHLLLLLDNFEQVVTATPLLSDLLKACPDLKLFVTSRAVLHIQGEHEFLIPSLALPDLKQPQDRESLLQYAAVILFLQRAQAHKPDFQITQANARAIAEICVRLDGLPLALELAAARVKLLPPKALLARLSRSLQVLTGGPLDAPVRQQTLRNTIQWSYCLLDTQEQLLFQRLSVFVGGCTLQAIEAICAVLDDGEGGLPVLDRVASLIDKSLLQQTEQDGEEPRLIMLETLREFGLECLLASGKLEATRRAQAEYYLALVEEAETKLGGPEQAVWLEHLEREYDNLRVVVQWLFEQQEGATTKTMALLLGGALRRFWLVRGYASEGLAILERALLRSEGVAPAVRAKALNAAADMAISQGNTDRGEKLAQEGLALYREIGDIAGIALSLHRLETVARTKGNIVAAHTLTEESLALWRKVGNKERIAWSLFRLARQDMERGEYDQAQRLFEECLEIFREIENKEGAAWTYYRLAEMLYMSRADLFTIRSLLNEGSTLMGKVGDKSGIAGCLALRGRLTLDESDPVTARSLIEHSLKIQRQTGDREGVASSLRYLANIAAFQRNYPLACQLYAESLALFTELDNKWFIALCLEGLASVTSALGVPERLVWAVRLWGTAAALRETIAAPLPPAERVAYEHSVAAARVKLGERAFAATWTEGKHMNLSQVLATQPPETLPQQVPEAPQPSIRKYPTPVYPDGLKAREVEVLRLVAQGLTDAQVAEELVISRRTVNWYLSGIYGKIGVSSRSAATRYAIENKLL